MTWVNLEMLRSGQTLPVLQPADPDFAGVANRTWGPPAAPDVLVRPVDAAEVAAALRWAVAEGVEVAVRSGGHGLWAPLPGGLLIDLGGFDEITVASDDAVRVGAGCTWGRVADALSAHGLALSSGDTRSVGVGGNALGAGVGWLVRSVGLTVDQLIGVELVTVGGEVLEVSAHRHPELFAALRGGGGNFGVVTRFDFRACELSEVVHVRASLSLPRLSAQVQQVRDAMRTAPRALAASVTAMPSTTLGRASLPVLDLLWAGDDEAAAQAAFAPLLAIEGLEAAAPRRVPYRGMLSEPPPAPPGPPPVRFGGNGVWAKLPDEVLDAAATALTRHPASLLVLRFLGGALGDTGADATAIAWRDAEALLHWFAVLPSGAPTHEVDRVRALWSPVTADADAVCATFTVDPSDPDLLSRIYPAATLTRLRQVKRDWDPGCVLRRNFTVWPAEP